MRVIDEATCRATVEIGQFLSDYWHEVDVNGGRDAPAFYAEDSVLEIGDRMRFEGTAGVRSFYEQRAKDRTTRHTSSNLRVVLEGQDHATAHVVVANYAATGAAPITDLVGPALVSQVTCRCRRLGPGDWRFVSVRLDPIFVGNEPMTRNSLAPS